MEIVGLKNKFNCGFTKKVFLFLGESLKPSNLSNMSWKCRFPYLNSVQMSRNRSQYIFITLTTLLCNKSFASNPMINYYRATFTKNASATGRGESVTIAVKFVVNAIDWWHWRREASLPCFDHFFPAATWEESSKNYWWPLWSPH